MRLATVILTVILSAIAATTIVQAAQTISAAPAVIQYQATLTDVDGLNVNGDLSMEVWIYDSVDLGMDGDLNDGHLIYAELFPNVHIDRGVLKLSIGEGEGLGRFSGVPIPLEDLAASEGVYLSLYLNGERAEPRQKLGFRNVAMKAQHAVVAESLSGNVSISTVDLPDRIPANKVTKDQVSLSRLKQLPVSSHLSTSPQLAMSRIPGGIPMNKIDSGELPLSCIQSVNTDKVSSGEFPPSVTYSSSILESGDVGIAGSEMPVVGIGFISDGGELPIPAGYSADECDWIVNYRDADFGNTDIDYIDVYTGGSIDFDDGGTTVHCTMKNGDNTAPCNADYLIVCKRG